jgi:hypothetical protein
MRLPQGDGIGVPVATEVFGFWLLVHVGLKPERRGCSLPPSETEWTNDPLASSASSLPQRNGGEFER